MKFSFEADLDYQRQAIDAVTGLFKGQEVNTAQFTVLARPGAHADLGYSELGLGHGNMLQLDQETILANLHEVQNRTGLAPEPSLESMNFTIEMETGTGKTYVYLRTIYELNQVCGFTKFMVVVPSVAIKEGVETSIRMLRDHFGALYGNPPVSCFQFDGNNPSRARSFATSPSIEIMIVTVSAINKPKTNKMYQPTEDLDHEVAADLIRATKPIIIVDEPQSVYGDVGDGKKKGAGRLALEDFNALATFRYSATHSKHDRANLVYRLDAIAAYDKQLVKQIEVDSLVTAASGTTPYVKLLQVNRGRAGTITARIEADVEQGNAIKRKSVTVDTTMRSNLAEVTERALYKELNVVAINAAEGHQSISFDTVAHPLHEGESIGAEVSIGERARQMIAQTIRQHLLKEQEFAFHGRDIKVLSLIFMDSVAKYRTYGSDGEAIPGEYALMFEGEYARIAAEPQFRTLLTRPADAVAREAHQGYFSKDRRKDGSEVFVDTKESTDKGRQQADRAYHQIMQDKVGLTTPGTPIRFIFSHSALQEGWDNPNVFQICVLRNMGTERWRRQSIGRGLRLCVDGTGNRVHGFDINRLTVIANESYEEFADRLQREMADDLGIQFGLVTLDALARLAFKNEDGEVVPVSVTTAQQVYQGLLANGYINPSGKAQESLRLAVQSGDPNLTRLIEDAAGESAAAAAVLGFIKRLAKPIDIKKSGKRVAVPLVRERLESPEFLELWERISHRTEYRVEVDEEELHAKLVRALSNNVSVPKRKGEWFTHAVAGISQGGLRSEVTSTRRVDVAYADSEDLPDILSVLADRTQLTRKTLARVLTDSRTLTQFRSNPQAYIDQVSRLLTKRMEEYQVKGVRYDPVDPSRPEADRRYSLSLLREADIAGYAGPGGNIICHEEDGKPVSFAEKSIYEFLAVDSQIERAFALALRERTDVKAFFKLPRSFTIPTPLGSYNPDWAVVIEREDGYRYIVFETKGTNDPALLPPEQRGKTEAAAIHFDVLKRSFGFNDLAYAVVDGIEAATAVMEDENETRWRPAILRLTG
jgi:type III restriction enzyme